jgi:hypothetical protein
VTFTRIQDARASLAESSSDDVIRVVAALGLPSSACHLGDRPIPDPVWEQVMARARRGRLLGLLAEAVTTGTLAVTHSQFEQLKSSHLDAQARSVLLERTMLRLVDRMTREGVAAAVMAGLAASHSDYSEPSLRPVDRICLLVGTPDLPVARRLLETEGWRRVLPEPAPGFDQRFGAGMRMRDDTSVPLELIRTLAQPPYSLAIPAEALWDHMESVEIGGTKVTIPGEAIRLLHACASMAAPDADAQTIRVRDAAQAIYRLADAVAVVELARSWQLGALLAWGIRRVWQQLQLEESLWLTAWAECYEPAGWEKRALGRVADPHSGYAATALTAMPLVKGVKRKVAFARATLLPERSYRRGRSRQRLGRLVHLFTRRRPS